MKPNEIQSLKSSLRIEEVIARYVTLRRNGRNYTGLCPFHADHHPSLAVSPDKQTFCCFSCGEKGDVITFVQKITHCTFAAAVEQLLPTHKTDAHSIPQKNNAPDTTKDSVGTNPTPHQMQQRSVENERFLSLLLPYASGHTELSSAYLDFEVGQSPVQTPREWYALRGRIIFPIRSEAGLLVGFAGRRPDDTKADDPKYINTSTADGYRKGETLYGLHRAKAAIAKTGTVFITEGYKDTIAMHAAGFVNTVALSGTVLTAAHVGLLQKYATRAFLLLDNDEAGREGTRKALAALLAARIETDSLPLPEGEDPDSLFRKWGRKAFATQLCRLSSRPHSSESSLLAACLLYPDTPYPFKGSTCRFAEMLCHILPTDDLAFENKAYSELLRHLSDGGTQATLPPPLQLLADELLLDFAPLVRQDLALLARMLPQVDNRTTLYLGKLLFLYTEIRLLRQIRRAVQHLLSIPAADTSQRRDALIYIAGRRRLLQHVSECLDRPGVLVN